MNRAVLLFLLAPLTLVAEKASPSLRYQALRVAQRDPFRKIDGVVYHVRPKLEYLTNSSEDDPMPEWRPIVGEVLEIVGKDGMIVNVLELAGFRDESRVVRLLNYPSQDILVDGKYVACLAKRCGRFQYTNVRGSVSTVESWDYGTIPTPEETQVFVEKEKLERALREGRVATARQRIADEQARKKAEQDKKVIDFQKQRAAEGSAISQYDLAIRYLSGDGVEQDEAEARRLLKLSAEQGHKRAIEKLKSLP